MPTKYMIRVGDHLSAIAAAHGFGDFKTIWEDPDNSELRAAREDPHVLAPGDLLVIPDRVVRERPCATGRAHRFVLTRAPLSLRIRVEDLRGEPLGGAEVRFAVEGAEEESTTDGDGVVARRIAPEARRGALATPETEYELHIGALDPVSEPAGMLSRLSNLGYDVDALDEGDDEELRFSVACFQRDRGLPVTGEPDDVRADLLEAHGC